MNTKRRHRENERMVGCIRMTIMQTSSPTGASIYCKDHLYIHIYLQDSTIHTKNYSNLQHSPSQSRDAINRLNLPNHRRCLQETRLLLTAHLHRPAQCCSSYRGRTTWLTASIRAPNRLLSIQFHAALTQGRNLARTDSVSRSDIREYGSQAKHKRTL